MNSTTKLLKNTLVLMLLCCGVIYANYPWSPIEEEEVGAYIPQGQGGLFLGASSIAPAQSKNLAVDIINNVTYIHVIFEQYEPYTYWSPRRYATYWRCGILDKGTNNITWASPQKISPDLTTVGEMCGNPAMDIDSGHNVHVVWESTQDRTAGVYDNSEVYYKKIEFLGGRPSSWDYDNAAIRLTNHDLYSGMANICCDADGNAHIVYLDAERDDGEWQGMVDVYYTMVDADGLHQTNTTTRLNTSDDEPFHESPQVKVWSEQGETGYKHHIYTAWTDNNYPYDFYGSIYHLEYIHFKEYDPDTSSWSNDLTLRDIAIGNPPPVGSEWEHEIYPRLIPIKDTGDVSVFFTHRLGSQYTIDGLHAYYYDRSQDIWAFKEISGQPNLPSTTYQDIVFDETTGFHIIFAESALVNGDLQYVLKYYNLDFDSWSSGQIIHDGTTNDGHDFDMVCIYQDSQGWLHVLATDMFLSLGTGMIMPIKGVFYSNDGGYNSSRANSLAKKRTVKKRNKGLTAAVGNEVIAFSPTAGVGNPKAKQHNLIKEFFSGKSGSNLNKKDIKKPKSKTGIEENQAGSKDGTGLASNYNSFSNSKIAALELSLVCAPNPTTTSANLTVSLPASNHIRLSIYDISGRCVASLIDGEMQAGVYNVQWTTANATPGVYITRLECGDRVIVKRLVVSR